MVAPPKRQLRDVLRRVDTNSSDMRELQMSIRDLVADTRELQVENSRILRYLGSRA